MPMWEYELFIKALNDEINEENEKQQREMDKYDVDGYMKAASPKRLNQMTKAPQIKIPQTVGSMKF